MPIYVLRLFWIGCSCMRGRTAVDRSQGRCDDHTLFRSVSAGWSEYLEESACRNPCTANIPQRIVNLSSVMADLNLLTVLVLEEEWHGRRFFGSDSSLDGRTATLERLIHRRTLSRSRSRLRFAVLSARSFFYDEAAAHVSP